MEALTRRAATEMAAIPPPPGITQNFVNPPIAAQDAYILVAVGVAIAGSLLLLRLYTKAYILKKFGWEDGRFAPMSQSRAIKLTYLVSILLAFVYSSFSLHVLICCLHKQAFSTADCILILGIFHPPWLSAPPDSDQRDANTVPASTYGTSQSRH